MPLSQFSPSPSPGYLSNDQPNKKKPNLSHSISPNFDFNFSFFDHKLFFVPSVFAFCSNQNRKENSTNKLKISRPQGSCDESTPTSTPAHSSTPPSNPGPSLLPKWQAGWAPRQHRACWLPSRSRGGVRASQQSPPPHRRTPRYCSHSRREAGAREVRRASWGRLLERRRTWNGDLEGGGGRVS